MSDEQRRRMATLLGHHPDYLPLGLGDLLNKLIELERREGREALFRELAKLRERP